MEVGWDQDRNFHGKKDGAGLETSLVVQRIRLQTPSAGGPGSIPGLGIRSHMSQLRWAQPNLKKKKKKTMQAFRGPQKGEWDGEGFEPQIQKALQSPKNPVLW